MVRTVFVLGEVGVETWTTLLLLLGVLYLMMPTRGLRP